MVSVDPRTYQILVIASALELYAKTGMKANSSYTPKNMIAAARTLTSNPDLKARDYFGAATALRALLKETV